jgi:hypothetical protein
MILYDKLQYAYEQHEMIMKSMIYFKYKLVEVCDEEAKRVYLDTINDIHSTSMMFDNIIPRAVSRCYGFS